MIIVLKPNCPEEQVKKFTDSLTQEYNVKVNTWVGTQSTVLGLLGDTTSIDIDYIAAQDFVESVKRVQEPYKKANRKFHPDNTVITLPTGQKIGDGNLALIAGPCSVETEAQICEVAERVKASGATFLRGGAFKPRTSPYSFQGLQAEGLELLKKAKAKTGLPIVTEIMSIGHIPLFEEEGVDIIQVGARNMQNFELLKALGKINKPILLKRGLSNTIEELLMSAEYIMAGGNDQVILCERGIRTYETYTRNTLDISAVPILKKAVPSARRGRSQPRLRHRMAGRAVGYGGCGGRCRRPHHRGTQQPRKSPVRRRAVPHPGPIRPCGSPCAPHKGRPLQIERIIPSEVRPAKEDFPGRQAGGLAGQRSYPLLVNLDGASNFCYTNAVQHRTTAAKAPFASCSWSFSRAGKRRFCGKRRMDS